MNINYAHDRDKRFQSSTSTDVIAQNTYTTHSRQREPKHNQDAQV